MATGFVAARAHGFNVMNSLKKVKNIERREREYLGNVPEVFLHTTESLKIRSS